MTGPQIPPAVTTAQAASAVPAPGAPTIEAIHRDISFSNGYRMELIKTLMAIAAALFAFTVTFGPTLKSIEWKPAMWIGWAGLAVSMVGGIVHLLGWDHYYKSYLDIDWRRRFEPDQAAVKAAGKRARKAINVWRRRGMWAQFLGFAFGVGGVGLFAGVNIENAAAKAEPVPPPIPRCCRCEPAITPRDQACDASAAASTAPVAPPLQSGASR